MFVMTNIGYVPLSRVREARLTKSFDYTLYLDEGERADVTGREWDRVMRESRPLFPAAPGTTILAERSQWMEGEDSLEELACIGWSPGLLGDLTPVSMAHGPIFNALAVKHPCGHVETFDGERYPSLDAFRAAEAAAMPDAGSAQGDPANPANVSA